jgi:predicted nicotinamide N-methyase
MISKKEFEFFPLHFGQYTIKIMKQIQVEYKRKIEQRRLGDKLFVLETIRDLDEAIDTICEALSPDEQQDPFAEDLCPYFGILWPAAEALALYLNDHSELIRNKKLLELGCGLGLPSLVATHLGAKVLASDFHPDVEEYFRRNCRHSSLECDYQRLNWREDKTDIGLFDVVMGSDVLYESKHASEVAQGLIRFLAPGGKILLSDPGRAYLGPFVQAMQEAGFSENLKAVRVGEKEVFVFLFAKN